MRSASFVEQTQADIFTVLVARATGGANLSSIGRTVPLEPSVSWQPKRSTRDTTARRSSSRVRQPSSHHTVLTTAANNLSERFMGSDTLVSSESHVDAEVFATDFRNNRNYSVPPRPREREIDRVCPWTPNDIAILDRLPPLAPRPVRQTTWLAAERSFEPSIGDISSHYGLNPAAELQENTVHNIRFVTATSTGGERTEE